MQIWAGPVLDGDIFKVTKKNTAEKETVATAAAQEKHMAAGGLTMPLCSQHHAMIA